MYSGVVPQVVPGADPARFVLEGTPVAPPATSTLLTFVYRKTSADAASVRFPVPVSAEHNPEVKKLKVYVSAAAVGRTLEYVA
jgi:hypothetical protein